MRNGSLISTAVALSFCVPLAACDGGGTTGASVNTEEAAESIRDSERRLLEDFRSRDAAKVAAHYTEDATVMFPDRVPMVGNEAVETDLAESLADPAFAIDFANQKVKVAASGDVAYSRGTYTVSYTSPESNQPVTERGSYINVYERQDDGSWMIVEDIATPSAPAAPSAPVPA